MWVDAATYSIHSLKLQLVILLPVSSPIIGTVGCDDSRYVTSRHIAHKFHRTYFFTAESSWISEKRILNNFNHMSMLFQNIKYHLKPYDWLVAVLWMHIGICGVKNWHLGAKKKNKEVSSKQSQLNVFNECCWTIADSTWTWYDSLTLKLCWADECFLGLARLSHTVRKLIQMKDDHK